MLYRSIYFLFHDEQAVQRIIDELEDRLGLDDYQLHAVIARGHGLFELPGARIQRKSADSLRVERLLWYLSVSVFVISLIALVLTLLAGFWILSVLFGLLVLGMQLSGYLFTNRIPNAQLDRFRTALEQGDIVLQIDVPRRDVERVRSFVYGRYPDSHTNISNWHIAAFGR